MLTVRVNGPLVVKHMEILVVTLLTIEACVCRGVGLLERHTSSSVDSVENLEQAEVLHINQSADLIQPSEVHVNDTMVMVERAEPVLSDQGECARNTDAQQHVRAQHRRADTCSRAAQTRSNPLTAGAHLEFIYTKHQHQCFDNSTITLVICSH